MAKTAHYDLFRYKDFWHNRDYEDKSDQVAIQTLLNHLDGPHNSILDAGGGFGRNTLIYGSLFKQITLLDPSIKNLTEARNFLSNISNVHFVRGTSEKLPFKDESFDVVICIRVMHHLINPSYSLNEFSRVLHKDGYLILEVANKIHALARLRAFIGGRLGQINSYEAVERRSQKMISQNSISFVNHHPNQIRNLLLGSGFKILDTLSVSNFRSKVANIYPLNYLFNVLEKNVQKPLATLLFGPSIYFLAKKT